MTFLSLSDKIIRLYKKDFFERKRQKMDIITSFQELALQPKLQRAIEEMGFETPTEIQAQAIPLIRNGADVIGRSQTGTGKTMAFAIPAVEKIDTGHERHSVQVLIMCPTRELALQCSEEIKRLTKYSGGIHPVEVYGGAAMDRQIARLKRANIVIGTPGRIMDHMRRRTLRLDNVKLVVLDEADEMLSMGFKEDMETILRETPSDRQTVLFSATMPPSIMAITEEFQTNPQLVQINKKQVTVDNIVQHYVDVPMGRKTDALKLMLHYYKPSLAMIFCNTKKMVDELSEDLRKSGFNAEALHGDLKQSQRSTVMDKFRYGSTNILVATDVAARGIDVNDVEIVFNYDIPQNNEYYVHRIGRTGRIGKKGTSITVCSGRKQVIAMKEIARTLKSTVTEIDVPTNADIHSRINEANAQTVENALHGEIGQQYINMVNTLLENGHSLFDIAAAALQMHFSEDETNISDIVKERKQYKGSDGKFSKIVLDIGRASRVAPNHLVASITERSMLHGSDIGKIEIYDDYSVVAVPSNSADEVIDMMYGAKVCGKPVKIRLYEEKQNRSARRAGSSKNSHAPKNLPRNINKKAVSKKTSPHPRHSKRQG